MANPALKIRNCDLQMTYDRHGRFASIEYMPAKKTLRPRTLSLVYLGRETNPDVWFAVSQHPTLRTPCKAIVGIYREFTNFEHAEAWAMDEVTRIMNLSSDEAKCITHEIDGTIKEHP